ncbi:MAG: PorV/PorQ family protein [Candidatus Zixiibacteriota bacterium]
MKKYTFIFLLIALLAVSLSSVYAGNERRIGTAGAQELRIPVGSRGAALGGAVVADVYGVEAMFWNPAGLASLSGTEAMFCHLPYFADINANFFGVATNVADFGTIGASAKIVSIGDMEETTPAYPDGTGRIYSPTLSVFSLTYATQLTYRVSFGFTGNFIYEDIFEASATGIAFDVGFMYDPGWNGVTLGLAIKNYGPKMQFTGRGFDRTVDGRRASPESAPFELPSSFNFGATYNFLNEGANYATISSNFRSNNFSQDLLQGGVEYVYDEKYSLRAGYNYSDQNDYLYGFSAGAGVIFEYGETKFTLEYAWNQTDVFSNTHYFTGKINF